RALFGDIVRYRCSVPNPWAPSAGFEPAHTAPETDAQSPKSAAHSPRSKLAAVLFPQPSPNSGNGMARRRWVREWEASTMRRPVQEIKVYGVQDRRTTVQAK